MKIENYYCDWKKCRKGLEVHEEHTFFSLKFREEDKKYDNLRMDLCAIHRKEFLELFETNR